MGEFADFVNRKDAERRKEEHEPSWVPSPTPEPTEAHPRDGHEQCDTEITRLSNMMFGPGALVAITRVNRWLDAAVAKPYRNQPLAQDWGRVAKITEEAAEARDALMAATDGQPTAEDLTRVTEAISGAGRAIAALIACTGQNPRKGVSGTQGDLLKELSDTAWTAIFAIQHFTGSRLETARVMQAGLDKASDRAVKAGY